MRRGLATVTTLLVLSGFLLAVVLGLMVAFGAIDITLAVLLVVGLNFAILLISPTISDFIYGWLYDLEWITLEELRERSPRSASSSCWSASRAGGGRPRRYRPPDRRPWCRR